MLFSGLYHGLAVLTAFAAFALPFSQPVATPASTVPALISPISPLLDSAKQNLYASQRVRTVAKVRISGRGTVIDTVSVVELDTQGRAVSERNIQDNYQRQWAFDTRGNCTSLVESPTLRKAYTTLYSYNAALGKGQITALHKNGKRTQMMEMQQVLRGDTLFRVTTNFAHNFGGDARTTAHRIESVSYHLGPDTLLTHTSSYNQGKLIDFETNYIIRRGGLHMESGVVVTQAIIDDMLKRYDQAKELQAQLTPVELCQAMAMRLRGQYQPRNIVQYNEQRQLVKLTAPVQIKTLARQWRQGRPVVYHYTYDEQGRCTREEHTSTVVRPGMPGRQVYVAFTYNTKGLVDTEIDNRMNGKITRYGYRYTFY